MKTHIDEGDYLSMLQSWRGATVLIRKYSPSLRRVALELTRSSECEVLYIVGISCKEIHGRFEWADADVHVMRTEENGVIEYVIEDRAAGFTLKCGSVALVVGSPIVQDPYESFLGD